MNGTETFIKIFGITFNIDRVAFTLPIGDGYPIYWYAVIIATGLLLAMIYGFYRAPKFGIDKDAMFDVVLASFIVSLIGARAYYLLFDGQPITSIQEIFAVRDGGLAIYGAVIGAFATGYIMCRIKKVNVLAMFDLGALGFLIGQGIGRWGNFVNQEAFGTPTDSIFGMTGSRIGDIPVHPCFLYESFFCLIGFLLLHFISRKRQFDGQIITLYMVWYGVVRFFIEGLRTDSLIIGPSGLRISQVVSFVAVVAGAVLYFVLRARVKKAVTETGEYSGLFGDFDDENVSIDSSTEAEAEVSSEDETEATDVDNDEAIEDETESDSIESVADPDSENKEDNIKEDE